MGDKGSKDKGKREQQKKAQLSPKEKRKLKVGVHFVAQRQMMCAVVTSVIPLSLDIPVMSPVRLAIASAFRPTVEG